MNRYEQIWNRFEIDEIGKNQEKSIKKRSVSSISTDWFIESISIKSDLPIFIELLIDQIDIDFYRLTNPGLITGVMVYQLRGEVSIEHIFNLF